LPVAEPAVRRSGNRTSREPDTASSALCGITRDGLVARTAFPTTPAVEYALTPLGASLHTKVRGLVDRAAEHRAEAGEARRRYDAEHGS
jgi:DNA-binding HxlR family transcriptional regulator